MKLVYKNKEDTTFRFEAGNLIGIKAQVDAELGAEEATKMNGLILPDYTIYELALYLFVERGYNIIEVTTDDGTIRTVSEDSAEALSTDAFEDFDEHEEIELQIRRTIFSLPPEVRQQLEASEEFIVTPNPDHPDPHPVAHPEAEDFSPL